jgi:predicted transcriptional regulator
VAETTSIKLDPELKERVNRLAKTRDRSAHKLMKQAIAEFVDREEEEDRWRADAMRRWEQFETTGLHVTFEEADEWLAALARGERRPPPKAHR